MSYEELNEKIFTAGLYERTPGRYALCAFLILCGLCISIFAITVTDSLFVQIPNALFLAFIFVQAGMLGHDLSHKQVFKNETHNRHISKIVWGLFGGLSESMWYEQHSTHHAHVNQQDLDPDINIPFLFSEKQSLGTYALPKKILRYQHILFFATLPLWYTSKLAITWFRIPKKITMTYVLELFLAIIHFAILAYLLLAHLPLIVTLFFLVAHILSVGLYMGMAFAPNHKGEEVLGKDVEITWLHQITSTRNLFPSAFQFHMFGGLNLQIEHHLFPHMSRYQYPRAQKIVKEYCRAHNIRYHETTWLGSMREIYVALKREALRAASAQ